MKKLTKKAKIILGVVTIAILLLVIIILMNVFSKKNKFFRFFLSSFCENMCNFGA